ncbi:MerR family transcriptional regulator [Vibrio crassostreae]|uniref:Transcriptional regulator n=1 Tax=Vibrio crassostreae TaxID=246167 RepID=A0ABM9QLW9_9VIBR|nr:MerR family transcriptional regulator [Vibrio crassostreae]ROS69255.1 DNA-binding transcriptional MerR regulator [Vibrio crassostreae]TCL22583.1 DNA-binding transcriptional MerR regulator [Vibrio crassostreae]TCT38985.1 DNA-binding transcriptional MerR regulator [Vibrio crassostreae]TCT47112.1 DNA-binding transcriptional MerR regulator [Vibrio crassostreae]TCT55719.1 DNA-binding transcriptional MerR regulator [Vibrio crassostreae]
MYRISELAELVGLSRSTLLYYGKLGLIEAQRQSNGYRLYSEKDLQRVRLLQQLQAGGLTLKECQACLDAKIERSLLENRLKQLDEELLQKQRSRDLLAAMLGESGLEEWHESMDKLAPDAHLDWLIKQGFDEKQALRLKWLSKDMNEHEQYMADFGVIFEGLERLGPGTNEDTLTALSNVPEATKRVLEIGCGKGIATSVLTNAMKKHQAEVHVTAVDNDQPCLDILNQQALELGLESNIKTVCASMMDLPFEAKSFDLIWSEGSAYIMGVQKALKQWRKLLADDGILVVNDLVWNTKNPSESAEVFWQKEYPDMTTVSERIKQAKAAGYQVLNDFAMSDAGWLAYYQPLQKQVEALKATMPNSKALADCDNEIKQFFNNSKLVEGSQGSVKRDFDYHFFVLKKVQ